MRQLEDAKSRIQIPVSIALQYAEDVASEDVAAGLNGETLVTGDEIVDMFVRKLHSILMGTATPTDVSSFIHATECISGSDVLDWINTNGLEGEIK